MQCSTQAVDRNTGARAAAPTAVVTTLLSVASALSVMAMVATAAARDQERPRPERTPRHEGPQVRVAVGTGGIYAYQSLDGGSDEITGRGLHFELAVGEMVSETIALQLDLALFRAEEAERTLVDSAPFTVIHVGVGATHWVMPQNIYVSGSLGMVSSTLQEGVFRLDTEEIPDLSVSHVGLGLHLAAGKQWWLSQRTGLGITGSVLASQMAAGDGENIGRRWVLGGAVALSLSYR